MGREKMVLTLLEPFLQSHGSHYLNYVVDIGNAARARGIETKVFVDRTIERKASEVLKLSGIDTVKIFPTKTISNIRVRGIIWPLTTIIYASVLLKLANKNLEKSLICTVSGNLEYLAGASLALLSGACKRKLFVQMYSWETREHLSKTPHLIRFYRCLTENLVRRAIDADLLKVMGQGRETAEHIGNRLRRKIPHVPYVTDWSKFPTHHGKTSKPRIGFLGVMRAEKGFREFVEAIEKLNVDLEIIVQVQVPKNLAEQNPEDLIARLKSCAICRIVDGELSQYDYNQILSQLDIVVLPYRPDSFVAKTSNIFSEAIGLGKIVIAPSETLMGKILKKLGVGITYFPYSSEALSKGIVEALTHYDFLRRRSYTASDQWRRKNSSGAFLRRLLDISEIHN